MYRESDQIIISGKNLREPFAAADRKTILIVDDDPLSVIFLSKSIKIIGHDFIVARSGVEAIKLIVNTPGIDLILMDIYMPGMTGIEAAHQIRQLSPGIPIVFQSAGSDPVSREMAASDPGVELMMKPLHFNELRRILIRNFQK